jgi:hypothetical protein
MRTKTEYVVEKDDRGKNSVRKLGLSPVQRDGMEYEFTVVMDVAENHTARASKDRTSLFDGWCDRIGPQTGRMLRDWLDSGAELPRAMPASVMPAPVIRADWSDDAGIPSLEDEPPPVESTLTARPAINKAVPLHPQKPSTVAQWLDTFEARLAFCDNREEVEALLLSEEPLKAANCLRGAALARLRELRTAALARYPEPC